MIVLGAMLLVVATMVVSKQIFTRAQVADFFPSTCLGTWENPQSAQGYPETFDENTTSIGFTTDNSSKYIEGAEIFCGGFVNSDFETEGEIRNVAVTFVWDMKGLAPTGVAVPIENEIAPNETTPTDEAPEDTTEPTTEPAAPPTEPTSLFDVLKMALAQEGDPISTTPAEPEPAAEEPAPVEEPATEPQPQPSGEPVMEESHAPESSEIIPEEPVEGPEPAPEIISVPADDIPDDNFLEISYSIDGENWVELQKTSATNWKNLTLTIPVSSWSDVKNLQFRIKGLPTTQAPLPEIFLDGMLLEVRYDVSPDLLLNKEEELLKKVQIEGVGPQIITLPYGPNPSRGEGSFGADEEPSFDINLDNLPAPSTGGPSPSDSPPLPETPTSTKEDLSWLGRVISFLRPRAHAEPPALPFLPTSQSPVVTELVDPGGKIVSADPILVSAGNTLRVKVAQPKGMFRPGLYRLRIWFLRNNVIYFTESSFIWGVLVVNFNKSIYTVDDSAKIGFGVLDDGGNTICDAEIAATVAFPGGKTEVLSTKNGTIRKSETCGPITVTNNPDYSAEVVAAATGTYRVSVVAETRNGIRRIDDSFEVQDTPIFDIEREGPTRIYPPSEYRMTLVIKANEDYTGPVTETLPNFFDIRAKTFDDRVVGPEKQTLTWNVIMKKGDYRQLYYYFKAPDVSPELYRLGPLQVGAWSETREWQIAADAAGEVILLWDGNSGDIPTGWTCLSCSGSDPFYGVYPRASSSYGVASSSRNTFTFTLTFNNASNGATQQTEANTSRTISLDTHTHTWPNQTATMDVRPFSQNLYFIRAATTTIPAGAIGMFDVASTSSLPSGWTEYDTINSSATTTFLRGGENSTSTIGAVNRTFTVPQWTSGAASTVTQTTGRTTGTQVPVGAAGHTHTQATTTDITGVANPPAIGLVFAKKSSSGSVPNGLIAMFDSASLPADWNIISTSGSAFAGNLIKGTSSFTGISSGTSTFSDSGTFNTVSGVPNTTQQWRTGTARNLSDDLNTHALAFTYSIASTSSLPVYRDVILGKYTASNSAPTVTNVKLNNESVIILTPLATTAISVTASTSDPDGNISYATSTIYRTGVGQNCTADDLNCYQLASTSCSFSGGTTSVTCTVGIQFFAQATDASSSFSGQKWEGKVTVVDAGDLSASASSTGVNLNTLVAINVTPTAITYPSLQPNNDSGSNNQTTTVRNAGNSSTTLKVFGTNMTSGGNNIPVSSEKYSTTTFTYASGGTALSNSSTSVSGLFLIGPTSTVAVSSPIYWGIGIPDAQPAGTYTGVNTFVAVWSQ